MPIEIRELIIKTNIVERPAELNDKRTTLSKKEIEKLKRDIVVSCVEEIMDKINKEKER
jgi:hypothetical protein